MMHGVWRGQRVLAEVAPAGSYYVEAKKSSIVVGEDMYYVIAQDGNEYYVPLCHVAIIGSSMMDKIKAAEAFAHETTKKVNTWYL